MIGRNTSIYLTVSSHGAARDAPPRTRRANTLANVRERPEFKGDKHPRSRASTDLEIRAANGSVSPAMPKDGERCVAGISCQGEPREVRGRYTFQSTLAESCAGVRAVLPRTM